LRPLGGCVGSAAGRPGGVRTGCCSGRREVGAVVATVGAGLGASAPNKLLSAPGLLLTPGSLHPQLMRKVRVGYEVDLSEGPRGGGLGSLGGSL
jgi:hypothetical protein